MWHDDFVTEFLTTADVATILQVSPQRVRSLARDGVLPAVRDEGGAGWLFRADRVQEYQEHRGPRRGPGLHAPQGVPGPSQAAPSGQVVGQRTGQATAPRSEELVALQTENEELRTEVARLRAQCQDLSARLQRSRALSEVLVRELG